MGGIYTKYNFDLDMIKRNKLLVVMCMEYDEILKDIESKDLTVINLGLDLSRVLKEHPIESRSGKILDELNSIFDKVHTKYIVVKNLDILFNPNYKLNILNYFISLSRNKFIFIEWPGQMKDRSLEYSEISYPDHHRYYISDYKIAVIK